MKYQIIFVPSKIKKKSPKNPDPWKFLPSLCVRVYVFKRPSASQQKLVVINNTKQQRKGSKTKIKSNGFISKQNKQRRA